MRTSCVAIITLVLLIGSAGVVAATMNKEEYRDVRDGDGDR